MDNTTKVLLFSSIGVAVLVGVVIVMRNKNAATNIQYSNGNILDNSNGDVTDNSDPSSGLNSASSILDKYSANSWVTTTKSTIVSAIPQVDAYFNKPTSTGLGAHSDQAIGNGKPDFTGIIPIEQTQMAAAARTLIDYLEKKGSANEKILVFPYKVQYLKAIAEKDNIGLASSLTNVTNLAVQGIKNRFPMLVTMNKVASDKMEAARINLISGADSIASAGVLITLLENGKI